MSYWQNSKRIVIKIGSALLVQDGRLNDALMRDLVADISKLQKDGKQVVVVSSGAIALGRGIISKHEGLKMEEKQAAASCGQILLAQNYREYLATKNIDAAQILLTLSDTENRRKYLNTKQTIDVLLERNIVPIINENDTVSTDEIRYGDNDRLAARIAQMIEADTLVIMSDIEGLYNKNPQQHDDAIFIPQIDKIDDEVRAMADGAGSSHGSGGMETKILAAEMAMSVGCNTIILLGGKGSILNPERYSIFVSDTNSSNSKKDWIANSLNIKGSIVIDDGASQALQKGKSLLPVGIVRAEGAFNRGDAVIVYDKKHNEIARAISNFSFDEVRNMQGRKSEDINTHGRDEILYHNDIVMSV